MGMMKRLELLERENHSLKTAKMVETVKKPIVPPTAMDELSLVTLLQATHNKTPILSNLEKDSIFKFMLEYKRYATRCPKLVLELPQKFVLVEDLEVLADFHDVEIEDLIVEEMETFFDMLCKVHVAPTPMEAKRRLKEVKMDKDDLSLSTLKLYNDKFQFHVRCIGHKRVLRQKELAKIYVEGLRPKILQENVWADPPESLEEAMQITRSMLPLIGTIQSEVLKRAPAPAGPK